MRSSRIFLENAYCLFAATEDESVRSSAGLTPGVLPGSGAIVPIEHRAGPFDLTAEEWAATRDLLLLARQALDDWLAPDSYTLGWNDSPLHAHLHVLPRFDDEPAVGRRAGVRTGINVPENRRPDPYRPGSGRALTWA